MSSHSFKIQALLLTVGVSVFGCAQGIIDSGSSPSMGVTVEALAGSTTVSTCSNQVFKAVDNASAKSGFEYAWTMDAPKDASYQFTPAEGEFSFTARTPGDYVVTLTACNTQIDSTSSGSNCTTENFSIRAVSSADPSSEISACALADRCVPNCSGRTCGVDPICGVSCGTCGTGEVCDEAAGSCQTACVPNCAGRTCGLDPVCGVSCGECGAGESCDNGTGTCQAACVPQCAGRTCGVDPVCGESCGTCGDGLTCSSQGQCEGPATTPGRVVTMVMSLADKRLSYTDPFFRARARLAKQSVRWASRVDAPRVLVVRDDQDDSHEPHMIRTLLRWQRISANYMTEPSQGLSASDIAGYDVVWFSNPTHPVDNLQTVQVLTEFVRGGGGLILQGDDITQGSHMVSLTRLQNTSDGHEYCGQRIHRSRFQSYEVRVEREPHAVTEHLNGKALFYGSDIDSSTLIPNSHATVLAWARLPHAGKKHGCGHSKCDEQPVIVAYDMSAQ